LDGEYKILGIVLVKTTVVIIVMKVISVQVNHKKPVHSFNIHVLIPEFAYQDLGFVMVILIVKIKVMKKTVQK